MKTTRCPKCGGTGEVPDQISLGRELRALRDKHGKSLREVAQAMGISAPYLSDLELGRRAWSEKLIADFRKAARQLNIK